MLAQSALLLGTLFIGQGTGITALASRRNAEIQKLSTE